MSDSILVQPQWLADNLPLTDARLVDLCRAEQYAQAHLPGAVHLDYAQVVRVTPTTGSRLPPASEFAAALSAIGVGNRTRVIAYDDEGGGKAARLVWSLHASGHRDAAILNGGLNFWASAGLPLTADAVSYPPVPFETGSDDSVAADADYILARLGDPQLALVDARSSGEYSGADKRAARAGHIPGARHLEWLELMDRDNGLKLKAADTLRELVRQRGIDAEQEIVVYCHTHHRSALNYVVLKSLGFDRVRGYPGSWAEWGNREDMPVETGDGD